MRLLHSETIVLNEFHGDNIPLYAILSHTWGENEVSLQDMKEQSVAQQKAGYTKIQYCCAQAAKDKIEWVWVDTCCIDKSSSAELSEAINSMFRWYQNARICYAYLTDVSDEPDAERQRLAFGKSRWFTRGWTLQELIAPERVVFYDNAWQAMGTKSSLGQEISRITGIDEETLKGRDIAELRVAERMFWASKRRTTRIEDLAYCLMGIFDVNMPLLYGEGKKAFIRLQEDIIKDSEDQSLFAWRAQEQSERESSTEPQAQGLLAQSPAAFASPGSVVPFRVCDAPYSMTNRGLRITLPLLKCQDQAAVYNALLYCRERDDAGNVWAIGIRCIEGENGSRTNPTILRRVPLKHVPQAKVATLYIKNERVIFQPQNYLPVSSFQIRTVPSTSQGYSLPVVFTDKHWSPERRMTRSKMSQPSRVGLLFEGPNESSFAVVLGFANADCQAWCVNLPKASGEKLKEWCRNCIEHQKVKACAEFERLYHEDLGSVTVEVRLSPDVVTPKFSTIVDITACIEERKTARKTALKKLRDVF